MSARSVGPAVVGFVLPEMPGPVEMAGHYVSLQRLRAADHSASIHAAAVGADEVWDYMGYGPFATAQDYAEFLERFEGQADPVFYAIRVDGRALGLASFLRIEPAQGCIEIGHILLTPPLQRTVAASEALTLMIGWAFAAGYRRVEWKCNALNAASRRAALRLGFSFEGVFRQHMISKGRNRDTAWFSIIDSEWPALRAAYDSWLAPENFDGSGRQVAALSRLTTEALPGRQPV